LFSQKTAQLQHLPKSTQNTIFQPFKRILQLQTKARAIFFMVFTIFLNVFLLIFLCGIAAF